MDRKVRVSVDGGERPTWSADGATLFFRYQDTVYAAAVQGGSAPVVGEPAVVLANLPGGRYDTFPAGDRFITCRPKGRWDPLTRIDIYVGEHNAAEK
jgi:hypothetical protein